MATDSYVQLFIAAVSLKIHICRGFSPPPFLPFSILAVFQASTPSRAFLKQEQVCLLNHKTDLLFTVLMSFWRLTLIIAICRVVLKRGQKRKREVCRFTLEELYRSAEILTSSAPSRSGRSSSPPMLFIIWKTFHFLQLFATGKINWQSLKSKIQNRFT